MEGTHIGKTVVLTVKISEELLEELNRKVERGKRSEFIKEAIKEKLRQTPNSEEADLKEEIEQLKSRIIKLERVIKRGEPSIHNELYKEDLKQLLNHICNDETDRLIINHLIESGGVTTKELESVTSLKRRQLLTRIKGIANRTEEKFGKRIIQFKRTKDKGKRQAWWIEPNWAQSNQNI
ncbi:MAG: ribbon-helix-helix domain-containing protein [Candidatus Jordarchaeaceae archaeon]